MIPKSISHPRGGGGRGPSPALLLITMLLGFSTGILSGFLYQQHRQLGAGLTDGGGAGSQGAGGPAAEGEVTEQGFRVVRHDFSSSGGGGAISTAAPASSGGDSISGAGRAITVGAARSPTPSSSSSKTGLTPSDVKRVAAALEKASRRHKGDTIHTLFTSNGSPYQNIQGRIMYASYKAAQKLPGGDKLTGFTRILHRTTDDAAAVEIPSFRAHPLQPACDVWCEFPVKDRANAVVQWLLAAEKDAALIKGAWLLMLEGDYVWRKPLRAPGDAFDASVPGLGFVFDYINPGYPTVAPSIKEMCPTCDPQKVPRSGPAPVLMRPQELAAAAPDWEKYSAWIEGNERAKKGLDWVREMYAWDVAVAVNNISLIHEAPPASPLLCQPPHDLSAGEAAIYHYTWGSIYKAGEKEVWRFDKRDYTAEADALKVPHFALPPQPWVQGAWQLQDGLPVGRSLHETLTDMLQLINNAVDTLPDLTPA